MTKLTFFYQKRKDDAVRMGIELEDDLLLQTYVPGADEDDPALLWYIDLRCQTSQGISGDADTARNFFKINAGPFRSALINSAEEFRAGLDSAIWPIKSNIENLPAGTSGQLVCSAMKRVTDGELSHVLRVLADDWIVILDGLNELAEAVR